MKCLNCGSEVAQTEGKRQRMYCNDACRVAFNRNARRTNEQGITEQPLPNSSNPNTITEQAGKCWCCGGDVQAGLVCCGPCAWSGKAKEERGGRYPPLLTSRTPTQMEADLHSKGLTGLKRCV